MTSPAGQCTPLVRPGRHRPLQDSISTFQHVAASMLHLFRQACMHSFQPCMHGGAGAHPKEATTAPWTLMGGASWMYSMGDLVLPEI